MNPRHEAVPVCEFCGTPLEDDCGCDVCERCGGNHIEADCDKPCGNCGEIVCDGYCNEVEF